MKRNRIKKRQPQKTPASKPLAEALEWERRWALGLMNLLNLNETKDDGYLLRIER